MHKLLVAMETKESPSNSDEEQITCSRVEERGGESGRGLDDTEREVLRSIENMNEMDGSGSGESTLQQVLQSVLAMDDTVRENGKRDIDFKSIDETFVTDRRGRRKKKTRSKRSRSADSDSSFTISTPSESSCSSQSSLREEVAYNQKFLDSVEDDDDDVKPDDDMLRDYTATMSMVLGEDQSESERSEEDKEELMEVGGDRNESTLCEEKSDTSVKDDSSVYKTPSNSLLEENSENPVTDQSDLFLSPEVMDESQKEMVESKPLLNGAPDAPESKFNSCTPVPTRGSESPQFAKKLQLQTDQAEHKKTKPIRKLPVLPNAPQTESLQKVSRSGSTSTSESASSPTFKHPSVVSVSSGGSSSPVFADREGANSKSSGSDSRETSTSPTPFVTPRTPKQNKTKISVDRSILCSDSSSEQPGSDGSGVGRKKIPIDKSLLDKEPILLNKAEADGIEDDMDIPFADESEVDEIFYTPATSMKTKAQQPAKDAPVNKTVRKRLLPTPPKETPTMLSADQIREIRKSELEKAKVKARDKARLKSDEELGLQCMNRVYNVPANRVAKKVRSDDRDRRSTSYSSAEPQSSDTLADSDENRGQSTQTQSSTAETDYSSVDSKGKKKRQKTVKSPKSKKSDKKVEKASSKTESDPQKKEKRKSLLSKLLSNKSPEKSAKEKVVSESPSDSSNPNSLKKKKTPGLKSEKKKKRKSHSKDTLDSSLSDNIKGLQIGSVFYTAENGVSKTTKKHTLRVPLAPKAEGT